MNRAICPIPRLCQIAQSSILPFIANERKGRQSTIPCQTFVFQADSSSNSSWRNAGRTMKLGIKRKRRLRSPMDFKRVRCSFCGHSVKPAHARGVRACSVNIRRENVCLNISFHVRLGGLRGRSSIAQPSQIKLSELRFFVIRNQFWFHLVLYRTVVYTNDKYSASASPVE